MKDRCGRGVGVDNRWVRGNDKMFVCQCYFPKVLPFMVISPIKTYVNDMLQYDLNFLWRLYRKNDVAMWNVETMEEKVRRIGKKREKAIVKPETKIQHHGPKRGGVYQTCVLVWSSKRTVWNEFSRIDVSCGGDVTLVWKTKGQWRIEDSKEKKGGRRLVASYNQQIGAREMSTQRDTDHDREKKTMYSKDISTRLFFFSLTTILTQNSNSSIQHFSQF